MNDSIVHNKMASLFISNWSKVPITPIKNFKKCSLRVSTLALTSSSSVLPFPFFIFYVPFAFFWAAFDLRRERSITSFSQIAPIIDTVMSLFTGIIALAGTPLFDLSKFLRTCRLKPASSMKKCSFHASSCFPPFFHLRTLSLHSLRLLRTILRDTIGSNFLRFKEARRMRCLWQTDNVIEPIS